MVGKDRFWQNFGKNTTPTKKGLPSFDHNPLIFLELAMGFEPATC